MNGTLDLRTLSLRPHRREDGITKLAPVAFDPEAPAPRFRLFIAEIMGGKEALAAYLQRAIGYTLTGLMTEQVFFILYGVGSNGKSTFLAALSEALGDYAMQTPTETLMAKRQTTIPDDVARLRGARFVTATEMSDGRKLDEAFVKQVTGGDPVTARHFYRGWFQYTPTYKLFLAVNHKPRIAGTEHAIWRRIKLVPFEVVFEEPDRTLPERLRGELPGIVAWAVQGYRLWSTDGLADPVEVTNATGAYRAEEDVLHQFIRECCITRSTARVASSVFYTAYQQWCERNGEQSISQKTVGMRLAEKGFRDHKSNGIKVWTGVGLLETARAGEQGSDGEHPAGSGSKSAHGERTPPSGPDAPHAPLTQPASRRTARGGPEGMAEVPW